MKSKEQEQQIAYFDWLRCHENKYPELRWIHAIPNGGKRNIAVAQKLKREGVKSGVWDVFAPISDGYHSGLYIEMKYGKNRLTENQKEFREHIEKNRFVFRVCYSWIEAAQATVDYLRLPIEV